MQRSDKHGPRVDEELSDAAHGGRRSDAAANDGEWFDTEESPADGIPPETGAVGPGSPPGMTSGDVEGRFELARHLRESEFPADAKKVRTMAENSGVPQALLTDLKRLPDATYANVTEVWEALGHGVEDEDRRT